MPAARKRRSVVCQYQYLRCRLPLVVRQLSPRLHTLSGLEICRFWPQRQHTGPLKTGHRHHSYRPAIFVDIERQYQLRHISTSNYVWHAQHHSSSFLCTASNIRTAALIMPCECSGVYSSNCCTLSRLCFFRSS